MVSEILKKKFLLKNSLLGAFIEFLSVFSMEIPNPTIVTMKEPKHLLNPTKVTTGRHVVKTYHVKMSNGLISYNSQVLKQNPHFFIIQDC